MNEQIDMIIARKLAGEATEDDIRQLEVWIAADGRNKEEYEKVSRLWQSSGDMFKDIRFDNGNAWNKVAAKTVHKPTAVKNSKKTINFPAWTKYMLAAAAAVLVIGVFIMKPFMGDGMEVVIADNGNKELVLPDNSHVSLRMGSKLSYPNEFAANKRKVALEGEAFFEVTRNEAKPFVIDAQSVSVKVLGTSFNVLCDTKAAVVTVVTGKVQMTPKDQNHKYLLLTKGMQGDFAEDKLTQTTVENANMLFWRTGELKYENKPLNDIVKDLCRYYEKDIIIDAAVPNAVRSQLINISFNHQAIEQVLTELCLVAQCKWELRNNQYVILAR